MLESIFETTSSLTILSLLLSSLVSIVLGIFIALTHQYTSRYSKNFLITLAILPILVQSIIMMVNGSLGTSIAIVGAFSLVRFRSIPGTSKEILSVFFAMTIGLATGMGQLLFSFIITFIVCFLIILLSKTKFLEIKTTVKNLKIVIPDDLDYEDVFNQVFDKYLKKYELIKVKTVNLGSLFELTYSIELKSDTNEKKFLDKLREKNGNLKIILSHPMENNEL